jgi:OmpA-OmpF porin, OOP family
MQQIININILSKYCLLTIVIAFYFSGPIYGQRWKLRRYEVGLGIGTTQVFGDIGGSASANTWFGLKDIEFKETKLVFAGMVRYKLDPRYSIKLNAILGFGQGDDEGSRNDRGRSFKTTLFEVSTQLEYNLISEISNTKADAIFSRKGMVNNYSTFNAYAFLGIGAVYFQPKFKDTETLEPVDKISGYSHLAAVFPFGIGVKYVFDDRWLANAELGYRFTTTDYLDGYTQTSSSKHNDVYYFLTISVDYRLKTSRYGFPLGLDKLFHKNPTVVKPNKATKKPKSEKEAKERKF